MLHVGAALSPRGDPVTSALWIMGLSGDGNFARNHHIFSRASWSSLKLGLALLYLLLRHLDAGAGPLVLGIDETLERQLIRCLVPARYSPNRIHL